MITYDTIEVPLEKNDERTIMTEREAFMNFVKAADIFFIDHTSKNPTKTGVYELTGKFGGNQGNFLIVADDDGKARHVPFVEFVFNEVEEFECLYVSLGDNRSKPEQID